MKDANFVIHCLFKCREGWVQYSGSQVWAHEACSKVEDMKDTFLCDFCFAICLNKKSYFKSLTAEKHCYFKLKFCFTVFCQLVMLFS